jgi:thiamine monophosphate synthase
VLEAGANRIAVSSAVTRATRPRRVVERLKARLLGIPVESELSPSHDE